MNVKAKIKTDTLVGKQLEKELRRYPDTVQFIELSIVSDASPENYPTPKDGFEQIPNHLLINSDTVIGQNLVRKLQLHPQVAYLEYPYPTDSSGVDIETISVTESAKLSFKRLGEKYNRTFVNKYTR